MFRTILIVDADDTLREELAWSLRAGGYRVLEATTTFEALATLAKGGVDLLVLGLEGIGMGAAKILDATSTDSRLSRLSVLLVTARPELAPQHLAILRRPFTPEILADTVRSMIGPPRTRALKTPVPGQASIDALLDDDSDGLGGDTDREP